MDWTAPLITYYAAVIAVFCLYGLHRDHQVWRFRRAWRPAEAPDEFETLPCVTVQLPMFNERAVAERIIEAACAMDYPRDRFEVQVLDDSTDDSAEVARRCCRRLAEAGHPVTYVHRVNRDGFKAGALAAGLETATGEYIAMFDADFVPPSDFLRNTIHHFTDEKVGMVQARWTHLNRNASWLTQIQALSLDGHFVVEQAARVASGCWFNFNGTAGVWRRAAIDDAGGWHHDTLTEDTDLSYRAQLKGWRFRYLPHVTCPAELPRTITALVSQQHRWSKGLVQGAIKLLPTILRSPAPRLTKLEAFFHLTSPLPYAAIVLLTILVPAAVLVAAPSGGVPRLALTLGLVCLALGTGAAALFAMAGQIALGRSWWRSLLWVPGWMAIGIGLSVVNTRAILEALIGHDSPFVRTPKTGEGKDGRPSAIGPFRRVWPAGLTELILAATMIVCLVFAPSVPLALVGAPFLVLFATGYLAVGIPRLLGWARSATRALTSVRPVATANPLK